MYTVLRWMVIIKFLQLAHCQPCKALLTQASNTQTNINNDRCPLWFFFNATTNHCECFTDPSVTDIVKCGKQEAWLRIGYCMTYEEEKEIFIAPCFYFQGNTDSYDITADKNYIRLPNISQLNDYLCGPMNREGRLCSECIEGFGPSINLLNSACSNCTGVWYGVPLYLFLELVPITVFYFIVLLFRVNFTSAPMLAFVFFSHIEVIAFIMYGSKFFYKSMLAYNWLYVLTNFYGIWNLDSLRYVIPQFCISPKLTLMHATFLYYISAIYPLFLICITWICIELHFRDFKPVVWMWSKMSKCLTCPKCTGTSSNSSRSSVIDVFATFFLLSYAKIMFTSCIILSPTTALVMNNNSVNSIKLAEDPSMAYFSEEHLPYALVAMFMLLVFILPLTLLLILYPIGVFRSLLFKLCLSTRTIASLNMFVEKYYSCYRDKTDGGRDLRSFASMYFLLKLLINILICEITHFSTAITFCAILLSVSALIIALVRPYKDIRMNIVDSLILEDMALIALALDKYYVQEDSVSAFLYTLVICVCSSLPLIGLVGIIVHQIIRKLQNLIMSKISTRSSNSEGGTDDEDIQREILDCVCSGSPNHMLHPKQCNGKNINYGSIQYEGSPTSTPHALEFYVSQ